MFPRAPPHLAMGKSFWVGEKIDDRTRKASVEFMSEFTETQEGGVEVQKLETYKIIWNEAIDGVKSFINILNFGYPGGGWKPPKWPRVYYNSIICIQS